LPTSAQRRRTPEGAEMFYIECLPDAVQGCRTRNRRPPTAGILEPKEGAPSDTGWSDTERTDRAMKVGFS
jgi:hypothetical protein